MPTGDETIRTKVEGKIIKKGFAHNILMQKIRRFYSDGYIDIKSLSKLTGIPYFSLRRLLFGGARDWSADEFFRMCIICDCESAIAAAYKANQEYLGKLHRKENFAGTPRKKPGPPPDPNSTRQQLLKLKHKRKSLKAQSKYYERRRKEKRMLELDKQES